MMNELLEISGQKFYYYNIDNVINIFSKVSKCAIVIDEENIDLFIEKYIDFIGLPVHQIIFISETLNEVFDKIKHKNIYLIAAHSLHHSLQLAVINSAITGNVICLVKKSQKEVKEILKSISQ